MDKFIAEQLLETGTSAQNITVENPDEATESLKKFRSTRSRVVAELPSILSNPREIRKAREKMKGTSLKTIKRDAKYESKIFDQLELTTSKGIQITTSRKVKEISITSNQKGLAIGTIASIFGVISDCVLEMDVSSHWDNGFEIMMYYPERKGSNKLLKEFGLTTTGEAIFISTDPNFSLAVFNSRK